MSKAALRSRSTSITCCFLAVNLGKVYLGTMVPKQAEIASSSIFGYHNLIKAKVESPCNFGFTVNFQSKAEVPSSFTLPSSLFPRELKNG